jgi:hypothetical protein
MHEKQGEGVACSCEHLKRLQLQNVEKIYTSKIDKISSMSCGNSCYGGGEGGGIAQHCA